MHDLWSQRVVQEFYEQGDLEKHLGLEPLPFMIRDNHKTAYSNNQKGFLNYMVSPLYDCFASFNFKADHMMHLLQNLATNVTRCAAASGPHRLSPVGARRRGGEICETLAIGLPVGAGMTLVSPLLV